MSQNHLSTQPTTNTPQALSQHDPSSTRVSNHKAYLNALKNMKILVVEDLLDNQLLIKLVLRPTYAQVDIASCGKDGVTLALRSHYDAILMDIQMPFMDGHEATRAIRAQGCDTPIIALTANAVEEERRKCVTSGFNAFLTKPLDLKVLITTLTQFGPTEEQG